MISNYGDLKAAIANWANNDQLTDRIPEFVQLCEDRIGQKLRTRIMEATEDLTVDAQEVPLPTNYVGMRRIYIDGGTQLNFLTPINFWSKQLSQEVETSIAYTIEGENIIVGPSPGSPLTGKILYWRRFDPLVNDTDTNALFTTARGLYLYGSLIEAAIYLEDDGAILKWSSLFDDLIERMEEADNLDRYSGDALQTHSDVVIT